MTTVSAAGLRALTVRQPWAGLIATDWKNWETRTRPTKHRGPLAIHAGKAPSPMDTRGPAGATMCVLGAVVGIVDLTDCCRVEDVEPSSFEREFGDWSPGRYAWRVLRPVLLSKPVPCRGQLGLWRLPPAVAALVEVQWEQVAS